METWLIETLTASNALLALQTVLLLVSFTIITKLIKTQKSQAKQLYQIKNEIKAINSGNLGIGKKINLVSKEIANVELDKLTNSPVGTQEKSYQQASVLLKRGASVKEVVDTCDIAPDEAELLSIMTLADENTNERTNDKQFSREFPIAS